MAVKRESLSFLELVFQWGRPGINKEINTCRVGLVVKRAEKEKKARWTELLAYVRRSWKSRPSDENPPRSKEVGAAHLEDKQFSGRVLVHTEALGCDNAQQARKMHLDYPTWGWGKSSERRAGEGLKGQSHRGNFGFHWARSRTPLGGLECDMLVSKSTFRQMSATCWAVAHFWPLPSQPLSPSIAFHCSPGGDYRTWMAQFKKRM